MSSVLHITNLTARIIKPLAVFFFFSYFFLRFLLTPVHNPDFWWHLTIGKYIVQNHSLLEDDPYSYTTRFSDPDRKVQIHQGDWLAKVIFYIVYRAWDLKGIIVLRSLLLMLLLVSVFLAVKRQKVPNSISLLLIAGVFFSIINREFVGERPQLFTFLVFAITFYLLEEYRQRRSRAVFLVPFLVMVHSNLHAGYIICLFLITVYVAGEALSCFVKTDSAGRDVLRGLVTVWGLTVLLSMINPTGPLMLFRMFTIHGEYIRGILEWKSPLYFITEKISSPVYSYIAFLSLSLLGLRYYRNVRPTHLLLLFTFAMLSLVSFRYLIFFMCVAAPLLGRMISALMDELAGKRTKKTPDWLKGLPDVMILIAGIFLVSDTLPTFAGYSFREETVHSVPKDAADFLERTAIRGNMLNMYGFGGYLIWRLAPDKQVFIDGRGLDARVLNEYIALMEASEKPPLTSEEIIKKYTISYIVTSPLQPSGEIFPLVEKLFDSREWVLIYRDHLTLIFLKNDSRNSALARQFAMDKARGFKTIIFQASSRASGNSVNPYYPLSLGKVFFKMGNMKDAEHAFRMAYERDPENAELMIWMKKLETVKKSGGVKVQ